MTVKDRSDRIDTLLLQLADTVESGEMRKSTTNNVANTALALLEQAIPQLSEADAYGVQLALRYNVVPVLSKRLIGRYERQD